MRKVEQKAIERIESGLHPRHLNTLVSDAAMKGWDAVITHCIERSLFDVDSSFGRELLRNASQFGRDHSTTTQLLLNSGADPNWPKVMEYCGVKSLDVLRSAGGNIQGNLWSSLIVAIKERRKNDKALRLIELGVDVNKTDTKQRTPLMFCAAYGRKKVFEALVSAGADHLLVDSTGRSALRYAMESYCGCMPHFRRENFWLHYDEAGVRKIVRALRGLLPAQPEDIVLVDTILDDPKRLRSHLESGFNPDQTIRGSVGGLDQVWDLFLRDAPSTTTSEALTHGAMKMIADRQDLRDSEFLDSRFGEATLLMWAILAKAKRSVTLLLEFGADPLHETENGLSARKIALAIPRDVEIQRLVVAST